MRKWTYNQLKKVMDEFSGELDPDDPKTKKRLRIITAATELFLKHGYRRTSMADVARRAGVAKGTLYLYFDTKVDLLVHAIAEEKKRYFELMVPVLADDVPPRERLRRWLKLALVLSTEMPLISRLLGPDRDMRIASEEWMAGTTREDFIAMRYDFIGEMIELAVGPDRLDRQEILDRAKVLYGLVFSGMVADEHVRAGLSRTRYGELLADIILDGIDVPCDSHAPDRDDTTTSVNES